MEIFSTKVADIVGGVELETTLDGERIDAYVVTGVSDLEAIADIVPHEKVDAGAEIHVTSVDDLDTAQDQIDQVLENINPGDVAVFLCADEVAYNAALDLLGLPIN
jgi:enoyl-[acyl-carrier-protein] reductase (NADH)